jgi:histidinol-phosphate aminotransferase
MGGYVGLDSRQIVPGAGADELISICARAFLEPGDTAVAVDPTYSLYRVATEQHHARYRPIAAAPPAFGFPAEEVIEAAASADLVWLCVPDNPVGHRQDDDDVRRVIEAAGGIVVIDAAYAEFCRDRWEGTVSEYDHVVVLRTMSKAFGLAGIRVGYAMAAAPLADRLEAIRPPGSIATPSAVLAIAALHLPARAEEAVAWIEGDRGHLAAGLADLGFRVLPSRTNFVLAEVGSAAHDLEAALMGEGLVVRKFRAGPMTDYLRFTVRTVPDHDRLFDAIERNLP